MLGDILVALTDDHRAEEIAALIAWPELHARIARAAAAEGVPLGALVATRVRDIVAHGGQTLWLDLLGRMSHSPRPGSLAVQRVLAAAFPAPAHVPRAPIPVNDNGHAIGPGSRRA